MIKAHQIKLNPTKSQKILLHKSFGCARHSYNWALAKWKELYEAGEKPSAYSLVKLQNSVKKTEMPFYLEVNKCAPQYAIHNLEKAFKKFWKEKSGHPKFKNKKAFLTGKQTGYKVRAVVRAVELLAVEFHNNDKPNNDFQEED